MSLQNFKRQTANTVISSENASLKSMATDKVFDLFTLEHDEGDGEERDKNDEDSKARTLTQMVNTMPELWDESQYQKEYDVESFSEKNQ